MYRQDDFAKLRGHPEKGRNPHPKDGARAAQSDGGGYPGNVAGAHGGRQGGSERLVRGDIPLTRPGTGGPDPGEEGTQGQAENGAKTAQG